MSDYTPAQMRLIEKNRDINTEHDWWDHSIEEFAAQLDAFGIEVTTRTVSLHGGGTRKEPEVFFSVSFSQGDGAQFDCYNLSIEELIQKGREVMLLPDDHDMAYLKTSTEGVPAKLRHIFEWLESKWGVYLLSAHTRDLIGSGEYHLNLESGHYSHSGYMNLSLVWNGDEKEDYSVPDQVIITEMEDLAESLQEELRGLADTLHSELEDECLYLSSDDAVWEAIVANGLDSELEEDEEDEEDEECLEAA